MTNRERAERFRNSHLQEGEHVNEDSWKHWLASLTAEFDAVAQEASAQMRERCAKTADLFPYVGENTAQDVAEAIRALPLTEEKR